MDGQLVATCQHVSQTVQEMKRLRFVSFQWVIEGRKEVAWLRLPSQYALDALKTLQRSELYAGLQWT